MRSETPLAGAFATRRAFLKGCCAATLAWESLRGAQSRANELRVGQAAPPATLLTLQGERITTTDLIGHVVILTFWATWCAPCRDELPLLSDYAARHADAGLRILGFCLDDPGALEQVRKIAAGLSFPVGLLANSSAPGYGRIWRLPVNFTIDRAGRLVEDGWKLKQPSFTPEHLAEVIPPLLQR